MIPPVLWCDAYNSLRIRETWLASMGSHRLFNTVARHKLNSHSHFHHAHPAKNPNLKFFSSQLLGFLDLLLIWGTKINWVEFRIRHAIVWLPSIGWLPTYALSDSHPLTPNLRIVWLLHWLTPVHSLTPLLSDSSTFLEAVIHKGVAPYNACYCLTPTHFLSVTPKINCANMCSQLVL